MSPVLTKENHHLYGRLSQYGNTLGWINDVFWTGVKESWTRDSSRGDPNAVDGTKNIQELTTWEWVVGMI